MKGKSLDPQEVGKRLLDWFNNRVPEVSDVQISNFIRRAEGFSAETFTLSAVWKEDNRNCKSELVLRLDPGHKSSEYSENTFATQFKILKCIESAKINVPAPRAYWLEEDVSYLGGPFIIMAKLPGKPCIPWSPEGRHFLEHVAGNSDAPAQVVRMLAEMHQMDWRKYGLSFLGIPDHKYSQAEHSIQLCEKYLENAWQPEPIFEEAVCWLKLNKPAMRRASFVHGDFRTGNMMWEGTTVSGLTDWELSHIGDPHYDLGVLCTKTHRMDSPLMNYLIDRQFLYEYYEELTGWPVEHEVIFFWEVFFALMAGIFWMSSCNQFFRGKTTDMRRARGFISYLHDKQLVAEYLKI